VRGLRPPLPRQPSSRAQPLGPAKLRALRPSAAAAELLLVHQDSHAGAAHRIPARAALLRVQGILPFHPGSVQVGRSAGAQLRLRPAVPEQPADEVWPVLLAQAPAELPAGHRMRANPSGPSRPEPGQRHGRRQRHRLPTRRPSQPGPSAHLRLRQGRRQPACQLLHRAAPPPPGSR
uniref:RHD domain-containing protein n=1 Tax=Macrostomum lignano TaxID=282301 RepID=A0A1I8F3B3_9PLAT